jgi:hypothetical protein
MGMTSTKLSSIWHLAIITVCWKFSQKLKWNFFKHSIPLPNGQSRKSFFLHYPLLIRRVLEKIHFPGFFQSVKPANLLRNPKLFTQNERVVLSGQWKNGYFSVSQIPNRLIHNILF